MFGAGCFVGSWLAAWVREVNLAFWLLRSVRNVGWKMTAFLFAVMMAIAVVVV